MEQQRTKPAQHRQQQPRMAQQLQSSQPSPSQAPHRKLAKAGHLPEMQHRRQRSRSALHPCADR